MYLTILHYPETFQILVTCFSSPDYKVKKLIYLTGTKTEGIYIAVGGGPVLRSPIGRPRSIEGGRVPLD